MVKEALPVCGWVIFAFGAAFRDHVETVQAKEIVHVRAALAPLSPRLSLPCVRAPASARVRVVRSDVAGAADAAPR